MYAWKEIVQFSYRPIIYVVVNKLRRILALAKYDSIMYLLQQGIGL